VLEGVDPLDVRFVELAGRLISRLQLRFC
jgi:hypothetical protein